jgi:hypothetical protein
MSEERKSRKKYELLKLMVWPANKAYVTAVADSLNLPINEAARRIFTEAEARRLLLPKGFRPENVSSESGK